MNTSHAKQSAKRITTRQVPNDALREVPINTLSRGMSNDFRRALLWHMERHGTTIHEIVEATGVSRNVLNKLKGRENSSTSVENGMLIAAFYGKTLNEFIAKQTPTDASRLRALFELLQPAERQLLESQIRGIVGERAHQSKIEPSEQ